MAAAAQQTRAAVGPSRHGSKLAVYAALLGNIAVAATKFVAAFWTGSSSLLSEAIHSTVDTLNEILLLYGLHRSVQAPDENHPLGYGREIYFWSFVVALLVFTLGAGASAYEGIAHLRQPEPMSNPLVGYVVLGLSLLFESVSWIFAYRQFRAANPDRPLLSAIRRSKDPATFTVLLEDSAAVLGLLIAFCATYAAQSLSWPELDGFGSLGIAALLTMTAVLLARETKGLLIGEPADKATNELILRLAGEQAGVVRVNGVITTHLAPDQITALLSVEFEDKCSTTDIERAVHSIEARLRDAVPAVVLVYVKPQTGGRFSHARQRWLAGESVAPR
jgi:cation diffusion facilitator family transporter